MEILFTKTGKGGYVLYCRRKDGSITWKLVSNFFISHDLCHYAVETTAPLKHAFFGMVASGTDISDFELPKEQRSFQLTEEAILAEQLVNLLTIELAQGKMENLLEIFFGIYEEHSGSIHYRMITETKREEIRNRCQELMQQWHLLSVNNTLTLIFDE